VVGAVNDAVLGVVGDERQVVVVQRAAGRLLQAL
jgi:hypothetical protein